MGECVPLHSSSVGKAMLAWQPRTNLDAILQRIELNKSTHRTIRTMAGLLTDLEIARNRSYALDIEVKFGWRCVGGAYFRLAWQHNYGDMSRRQQLWTWRTMLVPSVACLVKAAAAGHFTPNFV